MENSQDEDILRVSSGKLIRSFSQFCDAALRQPVVITKNGRDRLIMISIDEYRFLRDLIEKTRGSEDDAEQQPLSRNIKK